MSLLMETASCKIQEEIVWKLAWSKSEEEYDALLRSLSEQAFRYFRNIDPETFVDFAIPARFDFYTSNLAESFNNLIGNAREENVIGLVEFIHLDWMTKWYERTRNKLQAQALRNLPKLYT
jgi:hypothetical protein